MTADEPDPAAPTELAGAAEAETRSAYAWGLADAETELLDDERRFSAGRITAAAVAASVVLIGAAAAVSWMQLRGDQQLRPTGGAPADRSAAVSPDPAPGGLLNGIYRVEYHWKDSTYRDTGRDGGGEVSWNDESDGGPPFEWLTFSSSCAKDCVATGQVLTQERQPIPGARTLVLKLNNGSWEDVAPGRITSACAGAVTTAESSAKVAMAFTPRPDGSLSGTVTTTVETNECGDQGNTVITPLTVTRFGDAA